MKKYLLIILAAFYITANGQIGIGSVSFSPVANSNDLELNIGSYCNTVHYFNDFTLTSNGSNHTINLCFTLTPLLMETNITTKITLTGLNVGDNQNFTINNQHYFNLDNTDCSNSEVTESLNFNLTTPLTTPRLFQLSVPENNIRRTSLFPNPTSGDFTIQLPSDNHQAQLSISDISGKTVFATMSYSSGDAISLNGLTKGLYFAKVTLNQSTETLKFLVR